MFNWWDDLLASIEAGIKAGIESGLQSLAQTLAPLLQIPEATAPFQRIALFRAGVDQPIAGSGIRVEGAAWCLESHWPQTIPLFELPEAHLWLEVPSAQRGDQLLLCRALVKTGRLPEGAQLFLSRSQPLGWTFSRTVSLVGDRDWHLREVPFHLKPDPQSPGLIKIGVEFLGRGVVWLRDIELLQAPAKLKPITDVMDELL
ncbi:hypothetical protein [Thermosynechococcus vestitus]|uniref:Tlr2186 protein n=1 Tax=Thermosynechococcus vestitus (strain NIES-2133 / IAM M-273 / BP-1) TaxID=197221 RepID=Q8DGX6_THEVB|nr:hypothetical protein [Thermosynechococcus vestitus]BAC09738.1 tlr2186 [Thermosynechococcus vestitus BP-1]BAY52813.1 hypothetical protein NIES2134_121070 [Thermostichus vulcanus NIES-2134]